MPHSYLSVFLVAFLCCIAVAQAAELGSTVDHASSTLAHQWQNIKGALPHKRIPNNATQLDDVESWAPDYAIGLVKIVGPGVAVAVITLAGSLLYGIFKLFRLCCCSKRDREMYDYSLHTDEGETVKRQTFRKVWCPTLIYALCWIVLAIGMVFGLLNNPRFTDGVDAMSQNVITAGNEAVNLGNGLLSNVTFIVELVPSTTNELESQFLGVGPLADDVEVLGSDINGTSSQVLGITNIVEQIDAGNTSEIIQIDALLTSINDQSQQIIAQMASLTDQIAHRLYNTLNKTLDTLDSKMAEINSTVDRISDTAKNMINQSDTIVNDVIDTMNEGKHYDNYREKVLFGVFVGVMVVTFFIVVGYFTKSKAIFNVVAALSFMFIVLLWLSGSVHFFAGMALYDSCPIVDIGVQAMLPKNSQAAAVLQGCLYDQRSVLDSMNITAYNLTQVFDYKTEFESFANFTGNFNFTAVDGYFDSINSLYMYNLSLIAANLSVADFGWNQSNIYTALNALNNFTYPTYYGLQNYTSANPNSYPPPKNQTVYEAVQTITYLVQLNQTIYNKTAVAKQQLNVAQGQLDILLANITSLHERYDVIKAQVTELQTDNITSCINILDNLQNSITAFFALGDCSFLGDAYVELRTNLCDTMQPSIDCLTIAQFLAGIALIPMAIIAEVLSFRVRKQRGGNYDEEGEDYAYLRMK